MTSNTYGKTKDGHTSRDDDRITQDPFMAILIALGVVALQPALDHAVRDAAAHPQQACPPAAQVFGGSSLRC